MRWKENFVFNSPYNQFIFTTQSPNQRFIHPNKVNEIIREVSPNPNPVEQLSSSSYIERLYHRDILYTPQVLPKLKEPNPDSPIYCLPLDRSLCLVVLNTVSPIISSLRVLWVEPVVDQNLSPLTIHN
jgi:hypothetical protein